MRLRSLVPTLRAFTAAMLLSCLLPPVLAAAPRLRVADGGRFLQYAGGKPFFYLGDTAWALFHRATREEADLYLADRAKKGFTVIQAVALAEFGGLTVPNAYGDVPLVDGDLTKPNEGYFKHVDYVVASAERKGLFVAMLPTWGDKWNKKWGTGPEIFTPENAEPYGEFLGKRYRERAIIWVLGGDRSPENDRHLAIIRALARGLKKGDGGAHLMTFHPVGADASSKYFHGDAWLDFNMFQSGHHASNIPNYEMTARDYALSPIKPTLDGEPRYEDHPIDWDPKKGWFDAYDARQAAYWSMLAGACGHTYGDHNIWQMWQPGREPISAARTPWRTALAHPGATHMGYLRRLFESRPYRKLVPETSLIVGSPGVDADRAIAARARDGSFAFVYLPTGRPVDVRLASVGTGSVRAAWFDPREGTARQIGTIPNGESKRFEPPTSGRGNDWVLILDDAARRFRRRI
jgi:hypothetical protein